MFGCIRYSRYNNLIKKIKIGIRFFLNSRINHITIRSSGTESKIRIFVQYKLLDINEENLQERKIFGDMLVKKLAYEVKNILEKIHWMIYFEYSFTKRLNSEGLPNAHILVTGKVIIFFSALTNWLYNGVT